ncbi:hypothetical protein DVS77_12510 [Mycolicibacterium moriokaense]|nr:hypothetical protein DVS77_12510 [Mycolicibacterium moriokaense]
MQTFTLTLGCWLQRLIGRNSLVRGSDRVETVAVLLVVAVALLAAPLAGAMGTATHDSLARRFAEDRATRQEVVAIVTDDSTVAPRVYEELFLTPVRWQLAGAPHTAQVLTDRKKAGDRVRVWIDARGELTTKPLTDHNAASGAVVTGFGVWFAVVGVASAAWFGLRRRLDRARYADWDRELAQLADDGGRTNRNA